MYYNGKQILNLLVPNVSVLFDVIGREGQHCFVVVLLHLFIKWNIFCMIMNTEVSIKLLLDATFLVALLFDSFLFEIIKLIEAF